MQFADNPAELKRIIERDLKKAIQQKIVPELKKELGKIIEDRVYNTYSPSSYVRTNELKRDGKILDFEDGALLYLNSHTEKVYDTIESGIGYSWTNSEIAKSKQARPFFSILVNDVDSGKYDSKIKARLDEAFKKGS